MNNSIFVLVADDDENDLLLTLDALTRRLAGAKVFTVRDGAEALDFLHSRGEFQSRTPGHPRFILLDLNMPRIDGWEVLRQIRADATLKTIPVVIFTSSKRPRDLTECYQLGANAYVVKPIDLEEFKGAIQDIEAFWAERNEPPPAAEGGATHRDARERQPG